MEPFDRTRLDAVHRKASGRERLTRLARFLRTVSPGTLTLGCWYRNGRGCAVGMAAALDPWFQAQGLRLADPDDPRRCRPIYDELSDWFAVAAFFGLSVEDCRALLTPAAYDGTLRPDPATVARRIERTLGIDEATRVSPFAA